MPISPPSQRDPIDDDKKIASSILVLRMMLIACIAGPLTMGIVFRHLARQTPAPTGDESVTAVLAIVGMAMVFAGVVTALVTQWLLGRVLGGAEDLPDAARRYLNWCLPTIMLCETGATLSLLTILLGAGEQTALIAAGIGAICPLIHWPGRERIERRYTLARKLHQQFDRPDEGGD